MNKGLLMTVFFLISALISAVLVGYYGHLRYKMQTDVVDRWGARKRKWVIEMGYAYYIINKDKVPDEFVKEISFSFYKYRKKGFLYFSIFAFSLFMIVFLES